MAIDPIDPQSMEKILDYIDNRNVKMSKNKRQRHRQEVLTKKPRPFKALHSHPGYSFTTIEGSMNIVGYTLPKLALAMDMAYTTLKGYVDGDIIPAPSLKVNFTDKKGIKRPVNIYTMEEAKLISNFIYDNFFYRGLTIDDYNNYKEIYNGKRI